MNWLDMIVRLVGAVALIDLVAVVLAGTHSMAKVRGDNSKMVKRIFLGILGGLFGMYATAASYTMTSGAQVSIRDVGPMMAGALGGPEAGVLAGLLAGLFRLFYPMMLGKAIVMPNIFTDGTTIPCAISTLLIGLLSGLLHPAFRKMKHRGLWGMLVGFGMEALHLFIAFLYLAFIAPTHGAAYAWDALKELILPFLISNSLAFGLLMYVLDMMRAYRDTETHAKQVEGELSVATSIQDSMLPKIFPDFPGRKEFLISASMEPAKEVGGDFYDFFFIDENHFAFLIADVSGKGVPAALFMVIAKTLIKNNLQSGLPLDEAMTKSNQQLLEGNSEHMFVTSWIGVLEIDTGILTYVNCGHNPPVLAKAGEGVCYLKNLSGLVLSGSKKTKYKSFTLPLAKGDALFLYTDGITEAFNAKGEQYGEKRLLSFLEGADRKQSADSIIQQVHSQVKEFAKGAVQSDDMTMLAMKINGFYETKRVEAKEENFDALSAFMTAKLQAAGVSASLQNKAAIILDELFSNIVKYSGAASLDFSVFAEDGIFSLKFLYGGDLFDPTKAAAPDLSVPLEKRQAGGLGILMVKKLSDRFAYEVYHGRNLVVVDKKY
jgi:anti-sigma regulatory factor (Ser/Thr protein kinase)